MNRRNFLQSTAATAAATVLPNIDSVAATMPRPAVAGKIPIKVLATNWGWPGTFDEFCQKAKESGYDGFEVWVPGDEKQVAALVETATAHGLQFGLMAGSWARGFDEHFTQYEKAVRLAATAKPLYINTHAGRDHFSVDENQKILEAGLEIAASTGVSVLCETHRGRSAFSANATHELMERIPGLRLTADLSHWCCVHEGLLGGYEDTMALALSRTDHVHARIGHAQGPQVNDPRAPEWADTVKAHFGWWDKIVENRAAAKAKHMTFLTEFGPPHYLPALPYTQQPVANQWDVNVHMMKLLRERYA